MWPALAHALSPHCFARYRLARTQAGAEHRADGLFQVAQRPARMPYLRWITSPCSVMRNRPATVPRGEAHQRRRDARHRRGWPIRPGRGRRSTRSGFVRRDLEQFHLRPLQGPARGEDAAVLAAVRIAQHDQLAVAARGQVGAVDRIGQQRRATLSGPSVRFFVVLLEQRRPRRWARAAAASSEATRRAQRRAPPGPPAIAAAGRCRRWGQPSRWRSTP